MAELFTAKQRRSLAKYVEASEAGEVFGMLKQMKESFETSLTNAQKEEMVAQSDFESVKATKQEQIAAGEAQLEKKTQELATTDEKNAQSKQDLEDTQASLAADTEFLMEVKAKCEAMDAEYAERVKARQLEMAACSKALVFLSSDEAHELFGRTLGFVQTRSTHNSKRRAATAKLLAAAAQKFQNPDLALLATKARIDAFTEVKAKIQDMVDKLVQEKEDEIKKKDFCIAELNTNEAETEQKQRDKGDLEAKIDDLTTTVATLTKDIETLKAEVAEMAVQLKRAGEDREKMNAQFQVTVADQRATQKLLSAALGILKGFYEKSALVQKHAGSGKQPAFSKGGRNENSGGVMGMIDAIIGEAKALEAEAIRAEEDAQGSYEDFVKETNNSIDAKTKDIINKSAAKAKAEAEKVESEQEKEAVVGELESLSNENADLHKDCDFTLKNFELRQGARDGEIEALKQAISIFSGASFSALLQNGVPDFSVTVNTKPLTEEERTNPLFRAANEYVNEDN